MKELTFVLEDGKVKGIRPDLQMVDTFFIGHETMGLLHDYIIVRPLTIDRIVRSILVNEWIRVRWLILRTLWRFGFIEPPLGQSLDLTDIFRYWHWDARQVKQRRQAQARMEKENWERAERRRQIVLEQEQQEHLLQQSEWPEEEN